jgi:hypothetical protein
MSDNWPDLDSLRLDLPLFCSATATKQARAFHERDEAQANVLLTLRSSDGLEKKSYEASVKNGSRLAPVIEQLRNAHGFLISGDGSVGNPYRLDDVRQSPTLARVTPEMKAAYYATPHWNCVRLSRLARDFNRCVLCWATDDLRCHHVSYANLFNEPQVDLLTLCDRCHSRVHQDCRLKFPSGVSVRYAHLLGWKGFEPWLLP